MCKKSLLASAPTMVERKIAWTFENRYTFRANPCVGKFRAVKC